MAFIELGSAPSEEEAAQLGDKGYKDRTKLECQCLIEQIRRQFGPEPPGASLAIRASFHEAGSYYQVVLNYSDDEGLKYGIRIEHNLPSTWDKEAKAILGC